MSEDKTNDLHIGIAMGELKHGHEQVRDEVRQLSQQVSHIVGALSTLTAKIGEYEAWRDSAALRHRAPSFTTESVEAALEKANLVQSESIRAGAETVAKPVLEATKAQTAVVAHQTAVVASGIETQTKALTKSNKAGAILIGVIVGALQVIQYLIGLGHH